MWVTEDVMSEKVSPLSVDPITLEVIRHGLVSAASQVDANITRTAFSPYIYEYKDYAVALGRRGWEVNRPEYWRHAHLVADSVGMAVRDGLEAYGVERLQHGDVLICNHAAVQGQHLNNVVMYTPILSGAGADRSDRILRDQHALDRYRRIGAAVHRHFHGRFAVSLDQTHVEG